MVSTGKILLQLLQTKVALNTLGLFLVDFKFSIDCQKMSKYAESTEALVAFKFGMDFPKKSVNMQFYGFFFFTESTEICSFIKAFVRNIMIGAKILKSGDFIILVHQTV